MFATPGGGYTGTREVADRIGWVFPAPLEHFRFEQFSAAFRDRALVVRRIAGAREDVAARVARLPSVAIMRARAFQRLAHDHPRTRAIARARRLRSRIRGRASHRRGNHLRQDGEAELELPLASGANRVTAIAFDARGFASNAAVTDVASPAADGKPDAWVVGIGIDRYPHLPKAMQLGVAAADARAIGAAVRAMEAKTYARVHHRQLLDADATPRRSARRSPSSRR